MALTRTQLDRHFGSFSWFNHPTRRGAVVIRPPWAAQHVVRVAPPFPLAAANGKPVRLLQCHKLIAPHLLAALQDLEREGLTSLLETFDGCWVPRHMHWDPGASLSSHSWGIALDLNAAHFPYGSAKHQHPRLVAAFTGRGFQAGETWHTPDPMHFEYAAVRFL
jgi:hypothetical protein